MELDKKLAFLQNMTHMALSHAAATPNVATPTGGMSHDKMLEFVRKVSEKGIQHLSLGGVLSGAIGSSNDFQAQEAKINPGTNQGQLDQAYSGAQSGLNQQQSLADTLTPGVAQGANTQSNLSNMLTAQANGTGPNPAQAQLNQATGQNIAQQAALAAGQRGAGGNAGLIAAQNAQQGAATQQQAVGQAATLGAQQQIAAETNLANLSGAQVAQGQSAVQGVNNTQQNEQNILQGANTAANNAQVSATSNYNNVNAAISTANAAANAAAVSGAAGALTGGSLVSSIGLAHGGLVKMDKGGAVLDANARKHIAAHNFALPGGRYPIHDENHARNALARVDQNGTASEKAQVKEAVHKKYPSLAGKKMAKGGEVKPEKMGLGGILGLAAMLLNKGGEVTPPQKMALGGDLIQPSQSFVGNWLTSSPNTQGPASVPVANIDTSAANPFAGVNGAKDSNAKAKVQGFDQASTQVAPLVGGDSIAGSGSAGAGDEIGGGSAATGASAGDAALAGEATGPGAAAFALAYKGGLMKSGGPVKASKSEEASVPGDSLKNDKVPALLSQGEVVIDRDTLSDKGPMGQMARAVAAYIESRNKKGKK